jgi:hypothetical protein
MSAGHPKNAAHSADVRMELRVNGHVLPIAQLGPGFLILRDPFDHPPAEGEIFISIDGNVRRRPVWLHDGLSAAQQRTRIARCGDGKGSAVG